MFAAREDARPTGVVPHKNPLAFATWVDNVGFMEHPKDAQVVASLEMLAVQEMQLLLAEKRTALSTLRTGIAVFALPLSVLSVLIATSKAYEVAHVIHWLVPLVLLCAGLVVLGVYLITIAVWRIRRYDRLIDGLKHKHSRLAELLD